MILTNKMIKKGNNTYKNLLFNGKKYLFSFNSEVY